MTVQPKPPEARCPGPSFEDIMRADGGALSDVLLRRSNPAQSVEDVPFARYTSKAFFELEMQKLWPRVWQYACRSEHIAEPGDYYVYDIGRRSILIVRTETGEIKAFHNSCLHRGTKLKASDTDGHTQALQCPFHGWTWSLGGALQHVPCAWDFPHVTGERFRLPEVRCESWNGFVFINFSSDAPSLLDYLEVAPEHFANWSFEGWYAHHHIIKELPANWKLAQESFMEAYHTPIVHPEMSQVVGDVNMQHDVFSDHVSRDLCAMAVSSPTAKAPLSQQELLDRMLTSDRAELNAERVRVPEGASARSVIAAHLRAEMAEKHGLDCAGYSDAEMIDSIKYNIFPNIIIHSGISLRLLLRFRPIGLDPDRCLFEQFIFRPKPRQGQTPLPIVARVGEDESYAKVPGLDPFVAMVLDQDTNIMRWQREGMHTSEKGAETLSRYQESRIRALHATLDKYLAR